MQKVVQIIKRGQHVSDRSYWMSKTAAERLSAIGFLRSQYPEYENQLSQELRRVCNIVKNY